MIHNKFTPDMHVNTMIIYDTHNTFTNSDVLC